MLTVVFLLDPVAPSSSTELCLLQRVSELLQDSVRAPFWLSASLSETQMLSPSSSLMHWSTERLLMWCRAFTSQSVQDCETFMFYQPMT